MGPGVWEPFPFERGWGALGLKEGPGRDPSAFLAEGRYSPLLHSFLTQCLHPDPARPAARPTRRAKVAPRPSGRTSGDGLGGQGCVGTKDVRNEGQGPGGGREGNLMKARERGEEERIPARSGKGGSGRRGREGRSGTSLVRPRSATAPGVRPVDAPRPVREEGVDTATLLVVPEGAGECSGTSASQGSEGAHRKGGGYSFPSTPRSWG